MRDLLGWPWDIPPTRCSRLRVAWHGPRPWAPHPAPAGRHWDGSPRATHRPRPLRVTATSPSRLLRAGQTGRCRHCGNRIDLYQRTDQRPIALHPAELAAAHVPESCRWHLSGGIAHPHGDGSAWCRIPHALLCPHRAPTCPASPRLERSAAELAVRTRRLIDTGAFTPAPPAARIAATPRASATPSSSCCCAATSPSAARGTRAAWPRPATVTAAPTPSSPPARPGTWKLLPASPQPGQLALPDTLMAVYDLATSPKPNNCAGAPSAAPHMPPPPAPPTSPWPDGSPSTPSCTRRTSTPACPTPGPPHTAGVTMPHHALEIALTRPLPRPTSTAPPACCRSPPTTTPPG